MLFTILNFVYNRIATASVGMTRQTRMITIAEIFRFGGSTKFGFTPGGGACAGEFEIACKTSGGTFGSDIVGMLNRLKPGKVENLSEDHRPAEIVTAKGDIYALRSGGGLGYNRI